jgi:hypothetical protein
VQLALTAGGLLLCLASAYAIAPLDPGPAGLLGAISPAWYVGLALLAIAIILGQQLARSRPALPVIALQLALTLTPAIAYVEPRYSWTEKHVGVTAYILLHGTINPKIDIYQAWPGLFAAIAWLCKTSTLASPLGVARWWPPVIDVATLLAFRHLAAEVLHDNRRAWLAGTLFVLGNTIGQDYFSPQATAYLLAIATFAVVYRHRQDASRMSSSRWVALTALAVATALTHQLTPYMVSGALVILALFGCTRSRFAPAVTLIPALGWAFLHFSYVKQYLNFDQFGNVTQNAVTIGMTKTAPPSSAIININRFSLAGGALLLGVLALSVVLADRRAATIALALAAASGGALILVSAYGNEGDFRILLFALPWLAVLASVSDRALHVKPAWLWSLAIPALLVAHIISDEGLDYINVVRPGDLQALQTFEDKAPAGSILIAIASNYLPAQSSARYPLMVEEQFPLALNAREPNIRELYRDFMAALPSTVAAVPPAQTRASPHLYVFFAQEPAANFATHGLATVPEYLSFESYFARSASWTVVKKTDTAELFRFR